jgi:hypothetical protein
MGHPQDDGWDTLKMTEAYTRAADQQRLAASAMHMLASEGEALHTPFEPDGYQPNLWRAQ